MGFYEKNATFFVPKSMLFNTNMKNGEKWIAFSSSFALNYEKS